MDPTTRFAELVMKADPPLDQLAECIAQHRRPKLMTGTIPARLSELAGAFRGDNASELLQYLVTDRGLRGNTRHYYDERNSMLDQVLEGGLGIPITLSLVMIEVGRRAEVPLVGIGMPGEFLVRDREPTGRYYNVFRGTELETTDVTRLFQSIHGPQARFASAFLQPVGAVEIVGRMLNNLSSIYQRTDRAQLFWVLRLRAHLPTVGSQELRRAAAVFEGAGRFWEAAEMLDRLRDLEPDHAESHRQLAARLRSRLN